MSRPTIAIVGLGQLGGSLAAALTRRRLARVVGVSRREQTVRRARRMGIVDEAGTRLSAINQADIVVLATPARTILRQIANVFPLMRSGAMLTDMGSTKAQILQEVRRHAPRAAFVGGHPMAGTEKAGLDGCNPDLFKNRPWILIPASARDGKAAGPLETLIRGVGARPVRMEDPRVHDLAVARISHIPYLLAYSLMEQPASAVRVAGNSLRDATRVALSDPEMVLDFLLTNPGPIRHASEELITRLRSLARLVGSRGEAALRRRLSAARIARQRLHD